MNWLRRQLGRDPALVSAFAILWAVALVPIWWPRFLTLMDLPQHLAAIGIWHRYGDPAWGYSNFYQLNRLPVPYWGYFFPVHLLSYVFPIEIANKLYLSAYAAALPVGVGLLARRMGRSPWLLVFAFPLVFNFNFAFGFITFCAGLAIYLFAVYALDLFLEQPTRRRAIAVALLGVAIYFTHLIIFFFFGLSVIVLFACYARRPRRLAAAAALLVPSLICAFIGAHAAHDGSTAYNPGPFEFDARFDKPLQSLQSAGTSLLAAWGGDGTYKVLLLLGGLWLAALLSARPDDDEARGPGWPYRLEALFVLASLMPFVLPAHIFKPFDLWMIGGRFYVVIALFALLLPRGRFGGNRGFILALTFLLALYYPLKLAAAWKRFDGRASSVTRLMRHVQRGSSTLVLEVGDASDPDVGRESQPYTQFHAVAQLLAGGYDPWSLDIGFPMIPKPGVKLPAGPVWKHPESFDLERESQQFDFLLTRKEPRDYSLLAGPNDAGAAPLVDADGDWRLYRLHHP